MPKNNPKHNKQHLERKQASSPVNVISRQKPLHRRTDLDQNNFEENILQPPTLPSEKHLRKIQKKYMDVLYDIEGTIIDFRENDRKLQDQTILKIFSQLLWDKITWHPSKSVQTSRITPKAQKSTHFTVQQQDLYDKILEAVELYNNPRDYPRRDLWDCIARIYTSALFWTQEHGPTGYLDYIQNFVPPLSVIDDENEDLEANESINAEDDESDDIDGEFKEELWNMLIDDEYSEREYQRKSKIFNLKTE